MMTGYRFIGGIAAALGLVLACGGSTAGIGGPGGTGDPCNDYYDAVFAGTCNGLAPPAAELARVRARFHTACQNALALPGEGVTSTNLEACAGALKAAGACRLTDQGGGPCAFTGGTLAAGAVCLDGSQCQSGSCSPPASCGTCTAAIAIGQPCPSGGPTNCVTGSTCAGMPPTCTAITYGDVGAACSGGARCKVGLYCDLQTKQCASPHAAGAPCVDALECAAPLACFGTPRTCQTPGPAGAMCTGDQDCAAGLGCASNTTQQCTTVTWVSAGQPCSDLARCLEGSCSGTTGMQSTCPQVIADGQPCTGSGNSMALCDAFAECRNGTCVMLDSTTCK